MKEFNRMGMGEGPREVLTQMIELQKEPGGQRVEAHPVLVSPGEGTDNPGFYSSDFPSGNLSMSRATGAMHDVQPAVPPLGNPPLLVQTDVQNEKSSPGDPVPPASLAPRYSPPPTPPKKTTAPVTTTVHLPLPAIPKNTPGPVAEPIEPPAAVPPEKEPATVIASVENKGPAPQASFSLTKRSPAPPQSLTKRPPAIPQRAKPADEDYSGGPNYRIGPEDVLHIDVWGNEELTRDVTVRPDGKISLPLIQDIQAEGLTATELSGVIQQKLVAYVKDPDVAVIVTEVNAPKVFVIGNVTRPGPYPLRSDMSVLQALSLAGGFTTFASPKKITVIRNTGGGREIRKVNYYDMIDNGEGNYMLKPGDTIVVP